MTLICLLASVLNASTRPEERAGITTREPPRIPAPRHLRKRRLAQKNTRIITEIGREVRRIGIQSIINCGQKLSIHYSVDTRCDAEARPSSRRRANLTEKRRR